MRARYDGPAEHVLVAVDPGVHHCGVAVGLVTRDGMILLHADRVDRGEYGSTAGALDAYVDEHTEGFASLDVAWVHERPVRYRGKRAAGTDIDDLIAVLDEMPEPARQWSPHEWKGNVPKDVHHERLRGALSENEARHVVGDHNAWDAVGLWLYAVGRVKRGGGKDSTTWQPAEAWMENAVRRSVARASDAEFPVDEAEARAFVDRLRDCAPVDDPSDPWWGVYLEARQLFGF